MNFDQFTYTQLNDGNRGLNNNTQDIKFSLVPSSSYLEDNRILQDFKKHTFGNHTKTEAMKQFEQSCLKSEIEKACYWGYQLLASGAINQIWERCYAIIFKNINVNNPNAPEWILEKEKLFRKIVAKKEFIKDAIIFTRNIQQIRNILTELITFICLSNKGKLSTLNYKFTNQEFDLHIFNTKTTNKHNIQIRDILGPNDSKEVVLAGNELYYAIVNKNLQECLYWLTWIYNWEKINIKKFKKFQVQARSIEGIDSEHQRDVSWLVWSIVQLGINKIKISNMNLDKQLNSLWLLYIFNWKPGTKTKRLGIIIWYISLGISPYVNFSTPIIQNMNIYIKVISNVNLMFQKIKKQERGMGSSSNYILGDNINLIIKDNFNSNNNSLKGQTNNNTNLINLVHQDNHRDEIRHNIKQKTKVPNIDNKTQTKIDMLFQLDGYL